MIKKYQSEDDNKCDYVFDKLYFNLKGMILKFSSHGTKNKYYYDLEKYTARNIKKTK